MTLQKGMVFLVACSIVIVVFFLLFAYLMSTVSPKMPPKVKPKFRRTQKILRTDYNTNISTTTTRNEKGELRKYDYDEDLDSEDYPVSLPPGVFRHGDYITASREPMKHNLNELKIQKLMPPLHPAVKGYRRSINDDDLDADYYDNSIFLKIHDNDGSPGIEIKLMGNSDKSLKKRTRPDSRPKQTKNDDKLKKKRLNIFIQINNETAVKVIPYGSIEPYKISNDLVWDTPIDNSTDSSLINDADIKFNDFLSLPNEFSTVSYNNTVQHDAKMNYSEFSNSNDSSTAAKTESSTKKSDAELNTKVEQKNTNNSHLLTRRVIYRKLKSKSFYQNDNRSGNNYTNQDSHIEEKENISAESEEDVDDVRGVANDTNFNNQFKNILNNYGMQELNENTTINGFSTESYNNTVQQDAKINYTESDRNIDYSNDSLTVAKTESSTKKIDAELNTTVKEKNTNVSHLVTRRVMYRKLNSKPYFQHDNRSENNNTNQDPHIEEKENISAESEEHVDDVRGVPNDTNFNNQFKNISDNYGMQEFNENKAINGFSTESYNNTVQQDAKINYTESDNKESDKNIDYSNDSSMAAKTESSTKKSDAELNTTVEETSTNDSQPVTRRIIYTKLNSKSFFQHDNIFGNNYTNQDPHIEETENISAESEEHVDDIRGVSKDTNFNNQFKNKLNNYGMQEFDENEVINEFSSVSYNNTEQHDAKLNYTEFAMNVDSSNDSSTVAEIERSTKKSDFELNTKVEEKNTNDSHLVTRRDDYSNVNSKSFYQHDNKSGNNYTNQDPHTEEKENISAESEEHIDDVRGVPNDTNFNNQFQNNSDDYEMQQFNENKTTTSKYQAIGNTTSTESIRNKIEYMENNKNLTDNHEKSDFTPNYYKETTTKYQERQI